MSSESRQVFSNPCARGPFKPRAIAFLLLVANLLAGMQCAAKSTKNFQGSVTHPVTVAPALSKSGALLAENFVTTEFVRVDAGTIAPVKQPPARETKPWHQIAERFGSLALTLPLEVGRKRVLSLSVFSTHSTLSGGDLIASAGDIVLDPFVRASGHFYRDGNINLAIHEQTVGVARILIGGLTLCPLVRNTFGVVADYGFQHTTYGSDAEIGLAVESGLLHSHQTKVRFTLTGGVGIAALAHASIQTRPTFLFVGELLSW